MTHHEGVAALRAAHLEPRRRDPALIDLIRGLARLALDLEHAKAIKRAKGARKDVKDVRIIQDWQRRHD